MAPTAFCYRFATMDTGNLDYDKLPLDPASRRKRPKFDSTPPVETKTPVAPCYGSNPIEPSLPPPNITYESNRRDYNQQSNSCSHNTNQSYTNGTHKARPKTNSYQSNRQNNNSAPRYSEYDDNSRPSFTSASKVLSDSNRWGGDSTSNNSYSSPYSTSDTIRQQPDIPPTDKVLHDTLKKYFNFTSFRENQLGAVNATCQGLDTLILMPTGGGKSICYQLPAILSRGVTIVVSPLKSLIEDQVNRLKSLNVETSALFGETTEAEANEIYCDLRSRDPRLKLLYVTPEKINYSQALMNVFTQLHRNGKLSRFVIDEAHCVSTWGADFRPDYRKLGKLRDQFPDVPIMALTATAPPKVRDDILEQLGMKKGRVRTFIQSFNRPNLKFEVRSKAKNCVGEICTLIRRNFANKCGIIYCLSRNDCELVAEKLRENAITSAPYHAGLKDEARKRIFNAWSAGTFQVVCATIAFGMGIDKADVRFVIHYSVPKSVEGYYQEAGRAGRDGQNAHCILYFSKSDLYRMKSMLRKSWGRKVEDKTRDEGNLEQMMAYVDNKNTCRRAIMLRYLGEEFDSSNCIKHYDTACDNCLSGGSRNSGGSADYSPSANAAYNHKYPNGHYSQDQGRYNSRLSNYAAKKSKPYTGAVEFDDYEPSTIDNVDESSNFSCGSQSRSGITKTPYHPNDHSTEYIIIE